MNENVFSFQRRAEIQCALSEILNSFKESNHITYAELDDAICNLLIEIKNNVLKEVLVENQIKIDELVKEIKKPSVDDIEQKGKDNG